MKPQIGIIGFAGQEEYPASIKIDPKVFEYAYQLGLEIGKLGWNVVTGGKSGIMESANRGCQDGGGISIGVICGNKRYQGNQYLDVEIVSNTLNTGEEDTLIAMCDVVVMLGGGAGTLQELAIAYRLSKPTIIINGMGGWADNITDLYLDSRRKTKILRSNTIKETIALITKLIKEKRL